MTDNFEAYIDGLGVLEEDDLYLDIDETMEKRKREKREAEGDNSRRAS